MAISNRRFVRLPPDGAGKRVASTAVLYVEYTSAIGEFFLGDVVVGGTSAVSGHVDKVIAASGTTGELVIHLDDSNLNSVFTVGENLLVDSVIVATVGSAGTEVYYNEVVLVSGDNPANKQYIDERGAQYTTFAEGSPRLDAFGKLKVSQTSLVGNYALFTSAALHSEYHHSSGSAASTCVYQPSASLAILQVDTVSGSRYSLTTNKYHTYLPGVGMTVLTTAVMGDSGKTNLIRRWGYFDERNGLFWEQSGSILNAVMRNNAIDTKVPQSQWNGDRVDGTEVSVTNLSKFLLDVTKNNIYGIDFQWLGAGRVRFSVVDERGNAILVHEFRNANSLSTTYMGEGSLPIRYEILNQGITASTSEMKVVCATVQTDIANFDDHLRTDPSGLTGPLKIVSSSADWTYYFSGRAAKYDQYGKPNRGNSSIIDMSGYAAAPTIVEISKNSILGSPVWIQPTSDSAEIDVSASTIASGSVLFSTVINGTFNINLTNVFKTHNGEQIRRKADIDSDPDTLSVKMKLVSGSTPANVLIAANWLTYR